MSWLKRLSLSGSKADKQTASASATCAKLSRRSWPFSKTSMTLEDDEQDEECASVESKMQRLSVIRPPVGGGEYKGALPAGHASPRSSGTSLFEECMIEELLVQVFLNLSLEVCSSCFPYTVHIAHQQAEQLPKVAGLGCRFCSL